MPLFQYKAVTPSGEVQEGILEASGTPAAIARLQEMGLIPIRAEEAGAAKAAAPASAPLFTRNRITQADIGVVTRELATLLKAGLPLDRAFEILINLAPTPKVAELLGKVRNEIRGGASLSRALDGQRGTFSRFYVNMIRAGEAGGSLPTVLLRLAEYMERAKALRKAIPLMTQAVLLAGDALRGYGWLMLIVLAAVIYWAMRRLERPEVRFRFDRWLVTGRVVGSLFSRVEMARFSRTLGTLLANGVTLVAALNIVRDTMSNAYLAEAIGGVARELKEGRGLGRPMMEAGRFPMLAVHMILVGEETGRLDDMLMQVAETYDREVEVAIRKALALLHSRSSRS